MGSLAALERRVNDMGHRLARLQRMRQEQRHGGVDPVTWAHGLSSVHYETDAWQADFLRSDAKRLILLCSRQVGKSATVGLKAAHIVRGGGLCITIAPTQRQSALLFRQIRDHLRADGADMTRETQTEIELANGGHAVCLGGDRPSSIRGHSLRHGGDAVLCLDEAAFTRDDIWPAVSPMLAAAPNARMALLSTPCGPSGEFHRIWVDGGKEWERTRVPAPDCPRISQAFLNSEKARLGDALFQQEYMCEFVQPAGAFFSADLVAAMFDDAGGGIDEMFAAE